MESAESDPGGGLEPVGRDGRSGARSRVAGDAPFAVDHRQSRHRVHVPAPKDWAYQRGGQPDFIRPGKPAANAFIEPFNGRLRDECLNAHQFTSIDDAKAKVEARRVDYNQRRPHSSLGHLTPNEYAARRQEQPAEQAANL